MIGLAPSEFNYVKLNEAFRLLAGEDGGGKRGEVPLIVTHKARYFGDKDGKLSLGPGASFFVVVVVGAGKLTRPSNSGPFITALEEAAGCKAEIGQSFLTPAVRHLSASSY